MCAGVVGVALSAKILAASCQCPAGAGPRGSCKHLAALCYALQYFVVVGFVKDFQSCTDKLQTWNQPRKSRVPPARADDLFDGRASRKRKADDKENVDEGVDLREVRYDPRRKKQLTSAEEILSHRQALGKLNMNHQLLHVMPTEHHLQASIERQQRLQLQKETADGVAGTAFEF